MQFAVWLWLGSGLVAAWLRLRLRLRSKMRKTGNRNQLAISLRIIIYYDQNPKIFLALRIPNKWPSFRRFIRPKFDHIF